MISMNQSARYVTQSHIFDCPVLGPLTDRKIAKYQKRGYYADQPVAERAAKRRAPTSRQQHKQLLRQLLDGII